MACMSAPLWPPALGIKKTILKHIAHNLLRQDRTLKVGIANKRLAAGWNKDYRLASAPNPSRRNRLERCR